MTEVRPVELGYLLATWRERAKLGHQRAIDLKDACDLLERYDEALRNVNSLIAQAVQVLHAAGMSR